MMNDDYSSFTVAFASRIVLDRASAVGAVVRAREARLVCAFAARESAIRRRKFAWTTLINHQLKHT